MEKKKAMIIPDHSSLEKMEEGRRPQSIFSRNPNPPSVDLRSIPEPEVLEKAIRRKYPGEYKLQILKEADTCTQPGQLGALLRREGLYSSNLTTWRRQKQQGMLEALSPKKRGRKSLKRHPLALKVTQLERENQKLRQKLHQAETIIDVQKKISEILQIPIQKDEEWIS
ncbi:MAG: transposase [Syntrophales bacterium LBB04]|nr:transposase [Syntrophales bacterium LBB04]